LGVRISPHPPNLNEDTMKRVQNIIKKENHLDTSNKLSLENYVLADSFSFISPHNKDLLKLHCIEIAKPELFEELEKQCKNIVLNKIYEYNRNLEESRVRSKTAEAVIERIKYFFAYAQHKQSLKMRFTLKEYEHAISLIDDVEKKKVEKWLDDNGGFDKYVLSGYTLS
jgi:hypothetical protein